MSFVTVPVRGRNIRLNPDTVVRHVADANDNTVVHLVNGEALTVMLTQAAFEAVASGEPAPKAKPAAKAAKA